MSTDRRSQAQLTKNYGIMKMDPYCRIRVGHAVFETPTSYNGAKLPSWNKCVQCYLPVGVDSMYLEIFDERSFTVDDRIAWCHVTIPQSVLNGDVVDDWYPLSGRQGEEKEGMINLVLSFTPVQNLTMGSFICPQQTMVIPQVVSPGMFYAPMQPVVGGTPVYQTTQLPPAPVQQAPAYTESDVQQMKDMFPGIETNVIQSVFIAQRGNKNASSLLRRILHGMELKLDAEDVADNAVDKWVVFQVLFVGKQETMRGGARIQ
ncbi:toll-interacting protein B-like [Octopus vulgaris]|uniref:Toll-interacting protein B-like n=1 Tax=Octopus vulgaris TaxID=6645 RepID=A0AA36BS49_OCTVU|nr:toll-interacting protein B-like [Octopus vulgaris]